MEEHRLNREDCLSLGVFSLLLLGFFSFFGRDLAIASAASIAVNVLIVLGVARFGV